MSAIPEALADATAALIAVKALFFSLDTLLRDDNADAVLKGHVEKWWAAHRSKSVLELLRLVGVRVYGRYVSISFTRKVTFGLKALICATILGGCVEASHIGLGNLSWSSLDESVGDFALVALSFGLPLFLTMTMVASGQLRLLSRMSSGGAWLLVPVGFVAAYAAAWLLTFPVVLTWTEGGEAARAWLATAYQPLGVLARGTATMQQVLLLIVVTSPIIVVLALSILVTLAQWDSHIGGPLWKIVARVLFRWTNDDRVLRSLGNVCGMIAAALAAVAKLLQGTR